MQAHNVATPASSRITDDQFDLEMEQLGKALPTLLLSFPKTMPENPKEAKKEAHEEEKAKENPKKQEEKLETPLLSMSNELLKTINTVFKSPAFRCFESMDAALALTDMYGTYHWQTITGVMQTTRRAEAEKTLEAIAWQYCIKDHHKSGSAEKRTLNLNSKPKTSFLSDADKDIAANEISLGKEAYEDITNNFAAPKPSMFLKTFTEIREDLVRDPLTRFLGYIATHYSTTAYHNYLCALTLDAEAYTLLKDIYAYQAHKTAADAKLENPQLINLTKTIAQEITRLRLTFTKENVCEKRMELNALRDQFQTLKTLDEETQSLLDAANKYVEAYREEKQKPKTANKIPEFDRETKRIAQSIVKEITSFWKKKLTLKNFVEKQQALDTKRNDYHAKLKLAGAKQTTYRVERAALESAVFTLRGTAENHIKHQSKLTTTSHAHTKRILLKAATAGRPRSASTTSSESGQSSTYSTNTTASATTSEAPPLPPPPAHVSTLFKSLATGGPSSPSDAAKTATKHHKHH